jgi:hypothetical protein
MHDDGGMRPAQQFGQNYTRLSEAVVVGLQSGEDQVKLFVFDRSRNRTRGVEGIEADEGVVFKMNGAVGSFG